MSFQHHLKHIKVYQGKGMQMFVLTYLNRVGPLSQVKVKFSKDENKEIEFEVFFGPLDKKKYLFG
jgi:hypothetical protein